MNKRENDKTKSCIKLFNAIRINSMSRKNCIFQIKTELNLKNDALH